MGYDESRVIVYGYIDSSFFFFFLMIRRPPSPTLFPYTTLSRSRPARRAGPRGLRHALGRPRAPAVAGGRTRDRGARRAAGARPAARWARRAAGEGGGMTEDRKSTRLNSSHLVISYAVFCLKKKN